MPGNLFVFTIFPCLRVPSAPLAIGHDSNMVNIRRFGNELHHVRNVVLKLASGEKKTRVEAEQQTLSFQSRWHSVYSVPKQNHGT